MPRKAPPASAASTRTTIADSVPAIPVKYASAPGKGNKGTVDTPGPRDCTEETRDLVVTEPRYNDGVHEGMWRDRRIEKTKPCLPPFRGCSIYTTSFKEPGLTSPGVYLDDYATQAAWEHRASSEGVHPAILIEASGPKCRENFTTTTDLMHHWMPQVCPKARAFNSRHLEWLPSQNLLACVGNLTQYGLKELMAARWAAERASLRAKPTTTHRAHFHVPCDTHRETSRRAVCRLFSSKLHGNNKILNDQHLRGQQILVTPNVLMGEYPVDACRDRLPIVPELPLERAPVLRVPDRARGAHPFPECCTGVQRCRRVPGGVSSTTPSAPFYMAPCQRTVPAGAI